MDTLTHGLAGALLARALPAPRDEEAGPLLRRREAWAGFLAAMVPDLDVLPDPFSAAFYISQHRGLTHSFVLLPVWAIAFALVAAAIPGRGARVPFRTRLERLTLVCVAAVASHILLDWTTSWGTMFFAPVSWERYALDWLFIVDLFLSGLLVVGLLAAAGLFRRGDGTSRLGARAGVLVSTAYVLLCGALHGRAMADLRKLAPPGATALAAIPQPLSPGRWLLLAGDEAEVCSWYVRLWGRAEERAAPLPSGRVASAFSRRRDHFLRQLSTLYQPAGAAKAEASPRAGDDLEARALAIALDGDFGRFARFPAVVSRSTSGDVTDVLVRDLRFGSLPQDLDPFLYAVRFDAAGSLVWEGFPSPRWRARAGAPPRS